MVSIVRGAEVDDWLTSAPDTYAFAESDLNEPSCANTDFPSNSTSTGPWTVTPSGDSVSRYLTADLTAPNAQTEGVSVVFQPDIKEDGNYSVNIYTPGCKQDDSCDTRGLVNITGTFTADTSKSPTSPIILYQTNEFDKYDQIYYGPVDANSGSFRPSVTLTPAANQQAGFKIVAQRVRFIGTNTTGGGRLNGLYEFDPDQAAPSTDFTNSTVDTAGINLDPKAVINSLAILDNSIFAAGNFSGDGIENILAISNGKSAGLAGGGLNAEIADTLAFEDLLFLAGNFTNTVKNDVRGLNNIAIYNATGKAFQAIGAGVNGRVSTIVALDLNITHNTPEACLAFTGDFDQINSFDVNPDLPASGFAVWVPSRSNWQRNLASQSMAINGRLTVSTNVTGSTPLLAGTISSQDINAANAVALTDGPLRINSLGVKIVPQKGSSANKKRAASAAGNQDLRGAVTGLFYNNAGQNITILGGHFTATSSDNQLIQNLVFLNKSGTVTGLESGIDDQSTFTSLATLGSVLYAGGTVTGRVNDAAVNGLILYDLTQNNYAFPQPPPLGGNAVAVNAISSRPKSQQVYVGGNFDTAGSLGCPGVCMYENGQWSQPGGDLTGVVSAFAWQGDGNKLLAGGNISIAGNATSLATYDAKKSVWSVLDGAAANVPGPVTALTTANKDGSQFWVSGTNPQNGSAFLVKYDGSNFKSIGDPFAEGTIVRGLSVFELNDKHDPTDLVDQSYTLLVMGQLNLPGFGNASAALYDGKTFTPFLLSTSGNQAGSMSQLFSEKEMKFDTHGNHPSSSFPPCLG